MVGSHPRCPACFAACRSLNAAYLKHKLILVPVRISFDVGLQATSKHARFVVCHATEVLRTVAAASPPAAPKAACQCKPYWLTGRFVKALRPASLSAGKAVAVGKSASSLQYNSVATVILTTIITLLVACNDHCVVHSSICGALGPRKGVSSFSFYYTASNSQIPLQGGKHLSGPHSRPTFHPGANASSFRYLT